MQVVEDVDVEAREDKQAKWAGGSGHGTRSSARSVRWPQYSGPQAARHVPPCPSIYIDKKEEEFKENDEEADGV